MFPSKKELKKGILETLMELGGSAKTADLYPIVTEKFTLSESELNEQVPSGANKWINKIQWMRLTLVDDCFLKQGKVRGVWEISQKGINLLQENR